MTEVEIGDMHLRRQGQRGEAREATSAVRDDVLMFASNSGISLIRPVNLPSQRVH